MKKTISIQNLATEVISKYKIKKFTISTAESCTGGMIGEMLTSPSGSSIAYKGGVIAYSNFLKIELLRVPEEIINKYGAVSIETANLMAKNIRLICKTDIGLSVTGIAGPTGGSQEKPIGTVFIGVSTSKNTKVHTLNLNGSRNEIRKKSTIKGLELLLSELSV